MKCRRAFFCVFIICMFFQESPDNNKNELLLPYYIHVTWIYIQNSFWTLIGQTRIQIILHSFHFSNIFLNFTLKSFKISHLPSNVHIQWRYLLGFKSKFSILAPQKASERLCTSQSNPYVCTFLSTRFLTNFIM